MWIKKPEFIFIIFALIFGVLYMILTPYNQVPDEESHLMRACEVADGIFYNKTPAKNVECDKLIKTHLKLNRTGEVHPVTGYPPVLYAFSALGLKAGEHFGGNVMFYMARIFNFLVWLILIAAAIRITPVFKYQFLFVALLPMSITEGMSLSADSFNNAFAFLFFAYVFKLIFGEKEVQKKDLVLLSVLSLISAFTKGAIYPIFLFIFLPMKKHKYLFTLCCFLCAFGIMSYWASINLPFINPGVTNPEYHKALLLHNPFDFVHKYISAVVCNSWYYIKSCIGILGWLNIRVRSIIYSVTTAVFLSMFVALPENKITKFQRCFSAVIFLIIFTMLHVVMYVTWTSADEFKIVGFQGRYLISFLPFLFVFLSQPMKIFNEKGEENYKLFLIIFIFLLLSVFALRLVKAFHPELLPF